MSTSQPNVVPAREVDPAELDDFYAEMFAGLRTAEIWRWLNRTDFIDGRSPLVLVDGPRAIGHAGLIPFDARIGSDVVSAAWFVDFAVRTALQRAGLGTQLIAAWHPIPQLGVGFPNPLSLGAARKSGWDETDATTFLFYPVRPFDHPRVGKSVPGFLRGALNGVAGRVLRGRYARHGTGALDVQPLGPEHLPQLETEGRPDRDDLVTPRRDTAYLTWRLLESPDADRYLFAQNGRGCAVLKVRRKGAASAVDVLLLGPDTAPDDCVALLADIALWAAEQRLAYVRQLTFDADVAGALSDALRPALKHPTFMYYSEDPALFDRVRGCEWRWEIVDNDFERF